ncbi:MAG: hypothetical protein ACX94B_12520 [Henriciella sp.]|nr:hypothetical protein [Hyphomonadaceae bacterium]
MPPPLTRAGEMDWDGLDYLAAGVLVGLLTVGIILVRRELKRPILRWAGTLLVVLLVALIWAQLAVGLI